MEHLEPEGKYACRQRTDRQGEIRHNRGKYVKTGGNTFRQGEIRSDRGKYVKREGNTFKREDIRSDRGKYLQTGEITIITKKFKHFNIDCFPIKNVNLKLCYEP